MANESNWEEHDHDAIVHTHVHYHVTHNFRELTGGFEHLSSAHDHEHDHAPIKHSHHPHQDFEEEHGGEAHIHDHVQPARDLQDSDEDGTTTESKSGARNGTGKKAPARRTKAPASST
jgi:hypothetical protein